MLEKQIICYLIRLYCSNANWYDFSQKLWNFKNWYDIIFKDSNGKLLFTILFFIYIIIFLISATLFIKINIK